MKRIVLSNDDMDRALGIEDCRHGSCVKRGRHVEHETDRGVRWIDRGDVLDQGARDADFVTFPARPR